MLVAGFASAEREAIRPIVDQHKQLYFYTNQYEGGVADANTFCTGPVCEQQVIPTVQYMIEKFGPKGYTLAADYNFGQLTAAWTRAFVPLLGGQIIAEEFIPLSVSEFSQVIARVQQAKPDWVMTLLVGQNQQNYYPQAAAAGLKFPMASTVNMAQGYEHKRFAPPSLAGMHNAIQYQLEVPTSRNRAFVKRWMTMFPQDPYIGEMAQNTYFTIHLYAKAARLAGTVDQPTVKKALEMGWNIEAPEGSVFLEPGTHHVRPSDPPRRLRREPQCELRARLAADRGLVAAAPGRQPDPQPRSTSSTRRPRIPTSTCSRRRRPELRPDPQRPVRAGRASWRDRPPRRLERSHSMDGLAVAASVLYQLGTNGVLPAPLGARADRHPGHDEHHQPRPWRADDDGRLHRLAHLPSGRALPGGRDPGLRGGGDLRRHPRAAGGAALLRARARCPRRHLGHQPDPGAGHARGASGRSCRRSRSPAAPSPSASIPSRTTG